MGFDSGLTSITGSVSVNSTTSLPTPSALQSVKNAAIVGGNNGATLITATAGKTLYICGLNIATSGAASMSILNDGTAVASTILAANTGIPMNVFIVVQATKSITVSTTGGAGSLHCNCWGYEV